MPVKNYFDNLYKIWCQARRVTLRLVYAEYLKMWVGSPTYTGTVG